MEYDDLVFDPIFCGGTTLFYYALYFRCYFHSKKVEKYTVPNLNRSSGESSHTDVYFLIYLVDTASGEHNFARS